MSWQEVVCRLMVKQRLESVSVHRVDRDLVVHDFAQKTEVCAGELEHLAHSHSHSDHDSA